MAIKHLETLPGGISVTNAYWVISDVRHNRGETVEVDLVAWFDQATRNLWKTNVTDLATANQDVIDKYAAEIAALNAFNAAVADETLTNEDTLYATAQSDYQAALTTKNALLNNDDINILPTGRSESLDAVSLEDINGDITLAAVYTDIMALSNWSGSIAV